MKREKMNKDTMTDNIDLEPMNNKMESELKLNNYKLGSYEVSKNNVIILVTALLAFLLSSFTYYSLKGEDKNIEPSNTRLNVSKVEFAAKVPFTEIKISPTKKPTTTKLETPKPSISNTKTKIDTSKTASKTPAKKSESKNESNPKVVDPKKTFTDKEGFLLDNVFYKDVLPSISDSHPYALKEGINFESGYYYSTGKNRCGVSMSTSFFSKKYEEYTEVDEQNIIYVEKNEYLTTEGCDFIKGLPSIKGEKTVNSGIHVGGMDIEVGNYQVTVGGFYIVGDSLKDYARGNFNLDSEKGASRGTILKIEKDKVYRFQEGFVLKKIN